MATISADGVIDQMGALLVGIGVADRKLLWGRSHNQCAFPDCQTSLTIDLGDPESALLGDAGVVLGEEAHIRSSQSQGPRHDPEYPPSGLDRYANLILLCPTHHTLVDKSNGRGFSIQDLEEMRAAHEASWSARESTAEETARVLAERTTASVALWEDKLGLSGWAQLTWALNSAVPSLNPAQWQHLFETGQWLLAKDWPIRFPTVRLAFERLAAVLRLITSHLSETFERKAHVGYQIERKHKSIPWDPELYDRLITELRVDTMTLWILTAELTRAANLVISAVRAELDPLYRFDEGVLLVGDGDGIIVDTFFVRVEYADVDNLPDLPNLGDIKSRVVARAEELGIDADQLNAYDFELR